MFGGKSSNNSTQTDSFASRAEHVCNRVLASVSSDTSRRWRTRVPYSRVREWTIFFVLIDYQEDICESVPLYDYQKLFYGLTKLSSKYVRVRCT